MGDRLELASETGLRPPASRTFINELPPELLLEIIDRALDRLKLAHYYGILYSLMLVCSSWAEAIKETPKLWFLVDKALPGRIPLVLERSKSMTLTIEHHKMGIRSEFDDALFRESYRWAWAWIEQSPSDTEGDLPRRLGTSTAPLLWGFTGTGREGAPNNTLKNFFRNQAPNLTVLGISDFSIPTKSTGFRNLRKLALGPGSRMDANTTTSFFKMLQSCRHLITLELMDVPNPEPDSEEGDDTVISLPKLTTIRIRYLKEGLILKLIPRLRIPRCTKFIVRNFDGAGPDEFPRLQSMPHLVATFASIFKAADRIVLGVECWDFRFTSYVAGERTFELAGEIGDGEGIRALKAAAAQWGLAELNVRLEVRVNYEGNDVETLLSAFQALPNITTILLAGLSCDMMKEILEFLGEPYTDTDGTWRWNCPKLENLLTERCDYELDDYRRMLNKRYGSTEGEHPRRLKYMNIAMTIGSGYCKEEVWPLYAALMPDGMLSWNPRVAEFPWGMVEDRQEMAEVSEDLEDDRVVQRGFWDVFQWY